MLLAPAKTLTDAAVFIADRAKDTHQLGADPKAVLNRLKARGRASYVVKNGVGVVIGTCSLTEMEPAIAVVGISLLPAYRGKGYGQVLLREVERTDVALGFIALRADIFDGNAAAISSFCKAGYRRYSLLEKPSPDPVRATAHGCSQLSLVGCFALLLPCLIPLPAPS